MEIHDAPQASAPVYCGWLNAYKYWDNSINWCRISSIHRITYISFRVLLKTIDMLCEGSGDIGLSENVIKHMVPAYILD